MCVVRPELTEGPYFVDEMLNRSDIREDTSDGSISEGSPLELTFNVTQVGTNGCTPLPNAQVDIWHCDAYGVYSDASDPGFNTKGKTFLRGYQVTDANGVAKFTTIYPGWYAGRITHIHFQVYLNNNLQVTATATSQIAFPAAVTTAVYNTAAYTKGQNTSVTSFAADNVFSDGTTYQMASISGDTTSGYAASLAVTIA